MVGFRKKWYEKEFKGTFLGNIWTIWSVYRHLPHRSAWTGFTQGQFLSHVELVWNQSSTSGSHNKVKNPSVSKYFSIAGEKNNWSHTFIPFSRVLALCEMQKALTLISKHSLIVKNISISSYLVLSLSSNSNNSFQHKYAVYFYLRPYLVLFGLYQVLQLRAWADLGAMATKGCSAFLKASVSLEPHHQNV